jgi:acid phosphatase type 7
MKNTRITQLLFMIIFLSGCSGIFQPIPTLQPTIALPSDTPTVRAMPPTYTPTVTPLPPTPSPTATQTITPTATPLPTATSTPVLLAGAGNIAVCGDLNQGDERTAALVERFPNAAVFTTGDNVYAEGTPNDYTYCFMPSWGRFKDRIRPSAGNHDYETEAGAAYYAFFGGAAGAADIGFYSYNLGDWHIVALNSNCKAIGCGKASSQAEWLSTDLATNAKKCTLLYWHNPRWSSGIVGGSDSVSSFWRIAVENNVEVVVNGDDHDYERFVPQDAEGKADPNGVREFVVGTGGSIIRDFKAIKPNSEVRYNSTNGIIVFTLYSDHYDWEFVPTSGDFHDSGSEACH